MTHLEKNLAALRRRNPGLADRIASAESPEAQLIVLGEKGYDLALGSRRVYGGDPSGAVDRFWSGQSLKNPMLLGFYGFDLGYHFRHYIEHPHPKNQTILVIERRAEVFRLALSVGDWSRELSNPKIEWLIGQEPQRMRSWFLEYFQKIQNLCYCGAIENVMWMPSLERDGPYYVEMAKALSEGSGNALISIIGDPEDHFRGILNILGNLPFLAGTPQFDSLQGIFKDFPGIVVSTGPSLNSALPALQEARGKAVFFACDSAVPVLLKAGIEPHFIACLERVVATQRLFEMIPPLEETRLVAIPLVHPKTIERYSGPKMSINSRGAHYKWLLGETPDHSLGMSASTMAYTGLHLLGCNPIILTGQDLAFERGSKRSHASGALEFLQEVGESKVDEVERERREENRVMGNDGTPILSWEPYRLIARCLEDQIVRSGKLCINAILPNYGIRIAHAGQREPSEAIREYCREPFDATGMIRQHSMEIPAGEIQSRLKELQGNVHKTRQGLARLRDRLLLKMESLSIFYHEHLPSLVTPSLEEAYEAECLRAEKEMNELLRDEPVFLSFLWPFLMRMHVTQLMRYYELRGGEGPFKERLLVMFRILEFWFREAFTWASRTEALLGR